MNYLLLKLAEEAAELSVAAIKYRIKRTERNLSRLEGEIADVLAILALIGDRLDQRRLARLQQQRVEREQLRIKGR